MSDDLGGNEGTVAFGIRFRRSVDDVRDRAASCRRLDQAFFVLYGKDRCARLFRRRDHLPRTVVGQRFKRGGQGLKRLHRAWYRAVAVFGHDAEVVGPARPQPLEGRRDGDRGASGAGVESGCLRGERRG